MEHNRTVRQLGKRARDNWKPGLNIPPWTTYTTPEALRELSLFLVVVVILKSVVVLGE